MQINWEENCLFRRLNTTEAINNNKLKLFEVDDIGDDGDDDLQHHYLPNRLTICFFKSALTNQVPLSDKQACLVQCRYISQSGAFHVAIGKYPVADK